MGSDRRRVAQRLALNCRPPPAAGHVHLLDINTDDPARVCPTHPPLPDDPQLDDPQPDDPLLDGPSAGSRPGRLIIVRHAKSSWAGDAADHDRPLSRRGRRDARALGAHLVARSLLPDRALVSDAVRCRQTWQLATEAGAPAGEVVHSSAVYEASSADLLDQVRACPASPSSLLVLGHNSAVVDLVRLLAPRTGRTDLWDRLDQKFPTSAVATLAVPAPWTKVSPGSAELLAYEIPRG